jgi:DNA-binding response OmpR family regulator
MARILLIDDEEHICHLYSEVLAEEGHEVFSLRSGTALHDTIDLLRPEAIILDIRLPDCDGLDLLHAIRLRHGDLPVVISTAYDSYRGELRAAAADYYVIKSFDLSELTNAIRRALEADLSMKSVNGDGGRGSHRQALDPKTHIERKSAGLRARDGG